MFMSLKLLKLRWKIFFWTFTGRINKLHSRFQVTLKQGDPNTVLIIFPADEPSFRVAYYTFRDLGKKTGRKIKYYFIVKEHFKGLFHLPMGETIYTKDSDLYSILSDERALLLALEQERFDIIVDLNPTFHLGFARLVSLLNSNMKVGFTSDFSDRFYNIQMDISRSGIMEKGFKQINWILAQ